MTGHIETVSISSLQKHGDSLGLHHYFFLATMTHHILRSAFNDFGPKFTCVDPTGEQPLTGMIVSVDKVRFCESVVEDLLITRPVL